jgi:hypothetical protein
MSWTTTAHAADSVRRQHADMSFECFTADMAYLPIVISWNVNECSRGLPNANSASGSCRPPSCGTGCSLLVAFCPSAKSVPTENGAMRSPSSRITASDRPFAGGECRAMVDRSPVALPAKAIAAMWRISTFSNRSTRMKRQDSRTLVRRIRRFKCKSSETSISLLSDQLIARGKFE